MTQIQSCRNRNLTAVATAVASGLMMITSTSANTPRLTANIAEGATPLTVTFTGDSDGVVFFGGLQLHFGDGHVANLCAPGSACRNISTAHTYGQRGVYLATLVGSGEGGAKPLASVQISVR